MIFEILSIFAFFALYSYMKYKKYKNVEQRLFILFIGILMFEILSVPMWHNIGFESWTYIYREVTLTLTLGWLSIFMASMLIIDHFFHKETEKRRYFYYLLLIEAIYVPLEIFLLTINMRGYSKELIATMTGFYIPFTTIPIEVVWAIPLFAALVITFYKYINCLVEHDGRF